jgi:DNA-directed RNA polymerase specialized sigma subunit
MLELYKGGATEKQIGETLGVDKAHVHRSIKRVLNDLAEKYSGMADQIRGL